MKLKHFSLLLACLPSLLFAQNAFDKRSAKKPYKGNAFTKGVSVISNKSSNDKISNTPQALVPTIAKTFEIRSIETKRSKIINTQHANELAYTYLYQHRSEIDVNFDYKQLTVKESTTDALGFSHVRMQQNVNGIPVFGAELLVHFNGVETYTHGTWANIGTDYSIVPKLNLQTLTPIAVQSVHPEFGFKTLSAEEKRILNYSNPEHELMVLTDDVKPQLCYQLIIRPNFIERWRVRIDANTGKVIETLNLTCHVDGPKTGNSNDLNGVSRTVNSYQVGSNYYLIDATRPMFNLASSSIPDDPSGAIWTIDADYTYAESFKQVSSTSATFNNPNGVSAHYNAGFAYEYYRTTFNRNSINGTGGTVISVINVSDENGNGFDNAFWNGSFMAYGNGKTTFKPLAGSLDVAGHEMTHGVVEKSANLEYKNQSGAINESMADVFGCMMDRNDWKLGEDVMKAGASSTGALRDMQDPHNGGSSLSDNFFQPKHMSEFYTGTQDNGGVHINSGIPNHAFYLFATSVTKEKAEQVYYRALTVYLTKSSVFTDLRKAVIQSCKDLYSLTEASEAADAFDAVGIYGDPVSGGGGGGTIGNNVDDLAANPGADFILYYDLDPQVSYTLSKATLSNGNTSGQITRDIKRKASVVDNGSYAVYVGSDSRIYSLNLDGSKTESIMSNETIWDNVAISKDGKRLAAITTEQDTAIYVYDFTLQEWKMFKLYNPTYSGVNSGGVLYADAIEWDHTGTKLLYDAKNIINSQSGTDYTYWDVGVIEVWNLETNNWSNGTIEKLFSSLPENVSIGNGVYSQRSPYIVAFDYIDGNTGNYYVLSYNINTGKSGVIFTGSDLGFPCFSRNDDKMIFNAYNTSNERVVAQCSLNADKISPNGNATVLIGLSKWGVWYANGSRKLLFDKKDILTFAFNGINPSANGVINGNNITVTVPNGTNKNTLIATFTSSAYSKVKRGSVFQTSGVNSNNFSSTVVYTVIAQDGTTKNYNVIVVEDVVSIDAFNNEELKIYPNPSSGIIYLQYELDAPVLTVFDMSGKQLKTGKPEDHAFDISELQSGVYIVHIQYAGKSQYLKLIKS